MPSRDVTKRILAESMLRLAEAEAFDKISVADITQHAGINRKTFYYHFLDKYDLLSWFFTDAFDRCRKKAGIDDFWSFFALLAACMDQYRALYKNILAGRDKAYFDGVLKQFLRGYMARYVPPARLAPDMAGKYDECIDFLCATFMATLEEWLVNWPNLSLEELIAITRFDKIL